MEIQSGEMRFGRLRLHAIRGPQEGVYSAASIDSYESVGDLRVVVTRATVGAGVYGYEGEEFVGILPSSVDFLRGSGLTPWIEELPWDEATRFNQGDAFFADAFGIDVPTSLPLATDDPMLYDAIRGLSAEDRPPWAAPSRSGVRAQRRYGGAMSERYTVWETVDGRLAAAKDRGLWYAIRVEGEPIESIAGRGFSSRSDVLRAARETRSIDGRWRAAMTLHRIAGTGFSARHPRRDAQSMGWGIEISHQGLPRDLIDAAFGSIYGERFPTLDAASAAAREWWTMWHSAADERAR